MNKKNHTLKKMLLLITTGMLSGCFESPSSPASSSAPSDIKPLKHTTSEPFKLPEGVTEIQSAFSESDTKDWGNAQNWTSEFYKNGEDAGYDLLHKFVPCRAQKPDLPTRITIYEGTCFVNESVELNGLEMSWNTRLTIPEGVVVKSIAIFDPHKVTIDGGGDFYATGKSSSSCTGNVTLNKFHAPEVTWCGMEASFVVNQAKLHSLNVKKAYVKERLDVSDIYFSDTMDISIHRLHITRSERDSACLTFCTRTRPLNIEHLSFDLGTRIEAYRKDERYVYNSATWQPTRLTGTLDVTHMNPVRAASFEPEGAIGEMIPVIIAEKGIVGDPNILRRHRRCVVSGYFSDFNKEYMNSFAYDYQGTTSLMWVDGTQLYWQRTIKPWLGGKHFLFESDHTFMKLARAQRSESLLGINDTTMKQVEQICNALNTQGKYIHDHATEAGIERYLEVLITPNAKDRVHKLLALADIQPHLNEHNVLSETGEQAVIDSFGYFNSPVTEGYYGLTTVNPSCMSPTATNIGLSLNTQTYKMSGAFHQTHATAQSPWTLGVEYRSKLSSGICGVLRTVGDGIDTHPLSAQLKGGIGYTLSPISNITVFAGTKGLLGNTGTETTHSKALPTSTIYSLDTGIEWSTCLEGHGVRVGGDISYRPNQTVAVRIADLGATVDGLTLESSYTFKGRVGYTYTSINGIQWVGDLSLTIGDRIGISAKVGVNLER